MTSDYDMIVLGAGAAGKHRAAAFATLGSSIDLVQRMDHILPCEPRPVGDALAGERPRIHLRRRAASVARRALTLGAWDENPGFLTLISEGEVLTGAYGLGPEAGEWMQQATVAIRARMPLGVLNDTIQTFPTFSEAFHLALAELTSLVPAGAQ